MEDPEIRRATLADAERLAEVYRSAYRENRRLGFPAKAGSATASTVSEWIRENEVYVAEVEGRRVGVDGRKGSEDRRAKSENRREGSEDGIDEGVEDGIDERVEDGVVGGVRLEETNANRIKLSRLGVHEDWKGEGIGSRLMDYAEETVRGRGYDTVWLTTPEEHPHLPEFYRRRGYEKTRTYPLEFRDYDEILMEREVQY